MKIVDAKAAVDKAWETLEKIPAWSLDKLKSKTDVIPEAQTEKRKVHFDTLMDILSSQECRVGTKAPKRRRTSRAQRKHSSR